MRDNRINILAKNLVNFALEVKPGKNVFIDSYDCANDFTKAIIEEVFKVGAYPFVNNNIQTIMRSLVMGMDEEFINRMLEIDMDEMKKMDYYLAIRKQDNINELSNIPEDKITLFNKYYGKLHLNCRVPRTRWAVLRYPNASMAQAASMSTEDFEDYYFKVCNLDYSKLSKCMEPLKELMDTTDKVHIIAPDTDLTFSLKNEFMSGLCDGKANIPDGEVCIAPVVESVNGKIKYNMPSTHLGTTFNDIYFEIENGVIVKATADKTKELNLLLDVDEGARRFGEFAIGTNPFIDRGINDILFDEKMTGSLHFTPGRGGKNKSQIHWDIVQSHLPKHGGGEIYFDNKLIRKDGAFVIESLKPLNQKEWI